MSKPLAALSVMFPSLQHLPWQGAAARPAAFPAIAGVPDEAVATAATKQ